MDIHLVWTRTLAVDRKEGIFIHVQGVKIEVSDWKKQLKEQQDELLQEGAKRVYDTYCGHMLGETCSMAITSLSLIEYDGLVPIVHVLVHKNCTHLKNETISLKYGFTPSTGWIPYDPAMKDAWDNLIEKEYQRETGKSLKLDKLLRVVS